MFFLCDSEWIDGKDLGNELKRHLLFKIEDEKDPEKKRKWKL